MVTELGVDSHWLTDEWLAETFATFDTDGDVTTITQTEFHTFATQLDTWLVSLGTCLPNEKAPDAPADRDARSLRRTSSAEIGEIRAPRPVPYVATPHSGRGSPRGMRGGGNGRGEAAPAEGGGAGVAEAGVAVVAVGGGAGGGCSACALM